MRVISLETWQKMPQELWYLENAKTGLRAQVLSIDNYKMTTTWWWRSPNYWARLIFDIKSELAGSVMRETINYMGNMSMMLSSLLKGWSEWFRYTVNNSNLIKVLKKVKWYGKNYCIYINQDGTYGIIEEENVRDLKNFIALERFWNGKFSSGSTLHRSALLIDDIWWIEKN